MKVVSFRSLIIVTMLSFVGFSCANTTPLTTSKKVSPSLTFTPLKNGEETFQSKYSTIVLRDKGSIRSMYFVRDSGQMVLESAMDMKEPSLLRVPYTQVMMGALLFHPNPSSTLMIGVGGGSMPQYMQAYYPKIHMDAVDIDPEVIRIAQTHFSVQPSNTLVLHEADGFHFIDSCTERYDILFMDAFLKPSEETDATGTPLRLKTMSFYQQINTCLKGDGLVAFNINRSSALQRDLKNIRDSFVQTWVVPVPERGNIIVFASTRKEKITETELRLRAKKMDTENPTSLSYGRILDIILQ